MKAYIRYSKEFTESPVTYWLRFAAAEGWKAPPLPEPGPTLRGWRRYYVIVDGFEFRFAALKELVYVRDILSRKIFPPSSPNQHWLSRLPGWVKPWSFRQRAVRALDAALSQFLKTSDDPDAVPDPWSAPRKQSKAGMIYNNTLERKRKKNFQIALDQFSNNPKDRRAKRAMRRSRPDFL